MNTKLVFAKEAGKLAAYIFVIVGLAGTAKGQIGVVREAFKGTTKTVLK